MRWFYRLLWDGGNVAYHDLHEDRIDQRRGRIDVQSNSKQPSTSGGHLRIFGLGCLTWVFNSLHCLVDGGQTLTVASQDWKNRSGSIAVHVDLPTPSIRSETDPGKHTSRSVENENGDSSSEREAGIFDLLLQKKITRMPVLPAANYDDIILR